MIDYRELLKNYINFVGEEEGVTFIHRLNEYDTRDFTLEEIKELYDLDLETITEADNYES